MQEATYIADAVEIAKDKTEYDAAIKTILSDKTVLAWIISRSVKELRGYPIDVIKNCIEGEPEISKVPIVPGKTNEAIKGDNTEDKVLYEGTVYFDIRFTILTPGRTRIKLIINIEAQKKFNPGYDLVTRGIYYGARLLSSQKEREFTGGNYNDIKKVYSIWICMDAPLYAQNTITEYSIYQNKLYGDFGGKARYDLMSVVMICLGDPKAYAEDDNEYHKLLNLLTLLSSHKVDPSEKLVRLEQDYHIATTRKLEEGFNSMCNWSEGVIERITAEVTQEVTQKVTDEVTQKVTDEVTQKVTEEVTQKVTDEVTQKVTEEVTQKVTDEVILKITHSLGITFEKACEILEVSPTDCGLLKNNS